MESLLFAFVMIWITPIVLGIIFARQEKNIPKWFWFTLIPIFGFWVIIILVILKLFFDYDNRRRKKEEQEDYTAQKKSKKKAFVIYGIALLCSIILMSVIMISLTTTFSNSEPYRHSIELIEANSEIMEYLGKDYERKGMVSGSMNMQGGSFGNAHIMYKLKGKNGVSQVSVKAELKNGVWEYEEINFYKLLNSSEAIDLLQVSD